MAKKRETGISNSEIYGIIVNRIVERTVSNKENLAQITDSQEREGKRKTTIMPWSSDGLRKSFLNGSLMRKNKNNAELEKILVKWVKDALKQAFFKNTEKTDGELEEILKKRTNSSLKAKVGEIADIMVRKDRVVNPTNDSNYIIVDILKSEFEEKVDSNPAKKERNVIPKRGDEMGITDGEILFTAIDEIIKRYKSKDLEKESEVEAFEEYLLSNEKVKELLIKWVKEGINYNGGKVEEDKNSQLQEMAKDILRKMIHKEKVIYPVKSDGNEGQYLKIKSGKILVGNANTEQKTAEIRAYNKKGKLTSILSKTAEQIIIIKISEDLAQVIVKKEMTDNGASRIEEVMIDEHKVGSLEDILKKVQAGEELDEIRKGIENVEIGLLESIVSGDFIRRYEAKIK